MPLEQVLGADGAPLRIAIPMAGKTILVQAWTMTSWLPGSWCRVATYG
jgi:hypothetical protein